MTDTSTEVPPEDPAWAAEFATIYDSHRGRLVRWLTAIFGPRDAEDIAQEALTRLYLRPGLLGDDADAWPWLSVVARNVGRDLARHNAFTSSVDHDTLDQLPAGRLVSDEVLARDDAERLGRALARISPRDRLLLHLRDVDRVPVSEIATRLGANDNAVRQQLFRARKRLANAYLDLGGDRRAGLALSFERMREFVRRNARLAEPLGALSSGALAAALPAFAGIAGGVLFAAVTGGGPVRVTAEPPTPGPAPVPAVSPRPPATPPPGPPSGAAAPPVAVAVRPAPAPTFMAMSKDAGPVGADAWTRDPLSQRAGDHSHVRITVTEPVTGDEFHVEYQEIKIAGDGRLVCGRYAPCPTALPRPRDGR